MGYRSSLTTQVDPQNPQESRREPAPRICPQTSTCIPRDMMQAHSAHTHAQIHTHSHSHIHTIICFQKEGGNPGRHAVSTPGLHTYVQTHNAANNIIPVSLILANSGVRISVREEKTELILHQACCTFPRTWL